MKPLFNGQSEISQINKIFKELGTPSDKIWPGPPAYSEHPATKKMTFAEHPYNNLRNRFGATLTDNGFDLLNRYFAVVISFHFRLLLHFMSTVCVHIKLFGSFHSICFTS